MDTSLTKNKDNSTMDRNIPIQEQRKRKLISIGKIVAFVAIIGGILIFIVDKMMADTDLSSVVVDSVDRGTIEVSIPTSGKVVPSFEESIIAPISTKILEVYAQNGDSLEEGTPLLRLDLQNAESEYAKMLDEREIRRQQLSQLKINNTTRTSERKMQIEIAKMRLARLEAELHNEQYLDSLGSGTADRVRQAQISLETSRLELEQQELQSVNEKASMEAEVRMQELQLKIFEKGLEEKMRTLRDAEIRSPRKAILTYIDNEIGATVGMGTKVAVVSDLSKFKIDCEISENRSERIVVGGRVNINVGRETLTGSISSVNPLSHNGAIAFCVAMDNPSHPKLRSGLKVDVNIITRIKEDILRIKNASFYTGEGEYNLYVFNGDDELELRKVELGECNFEKVEVKSGLKEGDRVVISDMSKFLGMNKIKVHNNKKNKK